MPALLWMLVAMPRPSAMTIMVAMIPPFIIPPPAIEMPVAVVIAIGFVVSIQITVTVVVFVVTMEMTSVTIPKVLTVAVRTIVTRRVSAVMASCNKLDGAFNPTGMITNRRFNWYFVF